MLIYLWALSEKAHTLWIKIIKWIDTYIIKDHSLWYMALPHDPSWTSRKILKLRNVCQGFIKYEIGNDVSTFLWVDNWHPLGSLYKHYGDRVIYN